MYLALTMAPFAVVAPLLGPAIDRARGGRRLMILATVIGRGLLAFLMIRNITSLWLFPLAFAILVLQKGYSVAKSAVVPALVRNDDDLVGANSRLALLSAVASMAGATIAGGLSLLGGPEFAAATASIGISLSPLTTRTVMRATAPGVRRTLSSLAKTSSNSPSGTNPLGLRVMHSRGAPSRSASECSEIQCTSPLGLIKAAASPIPPSRA